MDINEINGEKLVKELANDKTLFIKTDVTCENSVQKAIDETLKKFKNIHVCVNSAGVGDARRV